MNKWSMQNYFKNLCNSYCVVLNELRRLSREDKKLNNKYEEKGLDSLDSLEGLLKLDMPDFLVRKVFKEDFQREKIDEEVKILKLKSEDWKIEKERLDYEFSYWMERRRILSQEIIVQIRRMELHSLIITTEEEILILIDSYDSNPDLLEERIINEDTMYVQDFPKKNQMCIDFWQYYLFKDKKGMQELYDKYIRS